MMTKRKSRELLPFSTQSIRRFVHPSSMPSENTSMSREEDLF